MVVYMVINMQSFATHVAGLSSRSPSWRSTRSATAECIDGSKRPAFISAMIADENPKADSPAGDHRASSGKESMLFADAACVI